MDSHFDSDPDAVARNRRTLVLMTDGSNTHGRPLSTQRPGDSHAGLPAARNIDVLARPTAATTPRARSAHG